nr:hypothetical protein [Polyangiaceae bacterium]
MNRPFRKGITLPRVSVLSHDPELQRVLGRMERNTEAAVQHLSRERMETLARTPIQRSDYDALLGEFVLIDPTGGAIT